MKNTNKISNSEILAKPIYYYNLDVFKILTNKGTSSYEDMQKKVKAELAKFHTNKLKTGN